jgi:hypothetical protein
MVGVALVDVGKSTCGGLALDEFGGWRNGLPTMQGNLGPKTVLEAIRREKPAAGKNAIRCRVESTQPTTTTATITTHHSINHFSARSRPPKRLHQPNADTQPLLLSPHRLPLRNEQGPTNHRHPEEVPAFSQEGYSDVRWSFSSRQEY